MIWVGAKILWQNLQESCDMEYFVQQIMNAFAFGAEYALLALGLAIVFSIMGLVNFAHGEMIAVGGYTMVAAAALLCAKSTDNYSGCDSSCNGCFSYFGASGL